MIAKSISSVNRSRQKLVISLKIENIPYVDGQKLSKEERENYEKIGTQEIKNGHYAVVTMAGGQRNKIRASWTKRNVFNANKTTAKISF